jgi:ArsR family transcriptional regulator
MAKLPNRNTATESKMKNTLKTRYEAQAKIIKAMAHPSRLLIIEELNKKEHCVGELTEMIGADASTVSKHLSILKNAGLVNDDKRGNLIFYTLRVPCIMQFMSCVQDVISANARQQNVILKCSRG